MKLFNNSSKNTEKNILILGDDGCGKRSLVLRYKDGEVASDHGLNALKTISYSKQFSNLEGKTQLNFVLDRSSEDMIPSISHKSIKYDLILIVTDVSSSQCADDLKYYSQYAQTHFPQVNTLSIGSKSDLKAPKVTFDNLILTSAKTGDGFTTLEERLKDNLFPSENKQGCTISPLK